MRREVFPFLLLLLAVGCRVSTVTPPPPPSTGTVAIGWSGNGNPGSPLCSSAAPPCLNGYLLLEDGVQVALMPGTALSYTATTTAGTHTFDLSDTYSVPMGFVPTVHRYTVTLSVAAGQIATASMRTQ